MKNSIYIEGKKIAKIIGNLFSLFKFLGFKWEKFN